MNRPRAGFCVVSTPWDTRLLLCPVKTETFMSDNHPGGSNCGSVRILLAVVLILQITLCGTLSADTDDPDSDAPARYEETIEVSARRPDDPNLITEFPAFVTSLEIDADIPRFVTLPELLNAAVGVTIRDFGGLGKLSTVSIRGSSANQVLVLLDGVRINTASDSGVDLSSLPLSNVERIEVLRGADSAVYGSGAMGGVVNLVTRKSVDDDLSLRSSITYGSYDTADVSSGLWLERGATRLRLTASYQHSQGDFDFVNSNGTDFNPDDDYSDTRENNGVDALASSLWFKHSFTNDAELSGSVDWFQNDNEIPGMITFPSLHAVQKDKRLTGTVRYEKTWPGQVAWRIHSTLDGKYIGLDFDDPFGEQTGVPIDTRQRTTTLGSRFGADTYYEAGSTGIMIHLNRESLDDRTFGDRDRDTVAVNARSELELLHDSLWLTGFLRYDDISDAGDQWSPKIGLRWFITDRLSLKANAGFGFRAPSFNELFMEAGYIVGNPDLMPEEASSYDFGVSYDATTWRVEAALFQIDSDDLIEYLLVSGFRYKPFNIGKARSRGLEIDGSVSLGYGLSLAASYTWDEAIDRTGEPNVHGKQIPGRPEHDIYGKLSWEWRSLTTWLDWHYLSGNYVTRVNTKELDERSTGNLGVTWRINEHFQIGAEIKNLNDDAVVDVRGFPLPPRSFYATVRMSI